MIQGGIDSIHLDLRFKGDRDYLHGTDMYDAILRGLIERSGCDEYAGYLSFHQFAKRQCDMYVSRIADKVVVPEERVCEGRFSGPAGDCSVWLVQTEQPVDRRYPYDEDAICLNAVLRDNAVRLTGVLTFTPIEIIVALTKYLHNRLFPLPNHRWIFGKLEFTRLLFASDSGNIDVILRTNLHNRITKSEVRIHDQSFGHIFFSAVPK